MATQTMPTPKHQFLGAFEKEHATTMKVLKAYPTDKLDLQPHKMCKTARELAWMFAIEQGFMEKGATQGFDWSTPPQPFPRRRNRGTPCWLGSTRATRRLWRRSAR